MVLEFFTSPGPASGPLGVPITALATETERAHPACRSGPNIVRLQLHIKDIAILFGQYRCQIT